MQAVRFFCTGNICRSPTAGGTFRAVPEANGPAELVAVDSAGTGSLHIFKPLDARACEAALQCGICMAD